MMLVVLLVPLPTAIMDLLLAGNIALAAIILLTVLFIDRPLEFSGFPSLLLVTTMFRLVLNIATTRLILSADATSAAAAGESAGKVIEQFAMFVAGSSVVVGVILFVILIVVQFVVITKGATRISEVAARFTLDGMPGKQMAIDADLNAGIIDEQEALRRRETISQEADFYGAMDGAAKFVRGDAVAGIIITLVNIAGGFTIGMALKGWGFAESLQVFTMLTIGDGLVSQVPAFIVSLAAALIVTRSSGRGDLGGELATQLTGRSSALILTAILLGLMAMTPLPTVPLLLIAFVLAAMAWGLRRAEAVDLANAGGAKAGAKGAPGAAGAVGAGGAAAGDASAEPTPEQSLPVEALELEIGYGLVRLVDKTQGGDLLDRISGIRRQLAREIGLVMPPIRIHDDMQQAANEYHVKIRGNTVARGMVIPGQFLAMGGDGSKLGGTLTLEPAFGLEATWIDAGQKQRAEARDFTVVDPSSVLATHLTETVKNHAHELLTRQEVNHLVEQLKERTPKLVEEVLGKDQPLLRLGDLQKVLQNLLKERVPIRDLETVLEVLGDWAPRTKDLDVLTEYVRNGLRRTICNQYVTQETAASDPLGGNTSVTPESVSRLYCVSVDPQLEEKVAALVERSTEGTMIKVPPALARQISNAASHELQRLVRAGHAPVILASPTVRAAFRQIIESQQAQTAVLGYNEVDSGVVVESLGLISLDSEGSDSLSGGSEPLRDGMPNKMNGDRNQGSNSGIGSSGTRANDRPATSPAEGVSV